MNGYLRGLGLAGILAGGFTGVLAGQEGGPPPMRGRGGPGGPGGPVGGMYRGMRGAPPGKWWSDPEIVQKLGITPDQQKRMEEVFQKSRVALMETTSALRKEESLMEPLMENEHPDEGKILLQIDKVAQARAGLEKANARMLLGMRGVLTQEQWKKLQAEGPRGGPRRQ